ncbi:MAG: hypothetical protein KBT03_02945 [Bacteroidales bacterium]|nr:hypothetical protein [Candidatus Scybalousia scybalohippi]
MGYKYSILYRNYTDECYREKGTNNLIMALFYFFKALPRYDGVDFIKRK